VSVVGITVYSVGSVGSAYLAQVVVLSLALLDEVGELRRQKLRRHIRISQ
jgi:hypothetical protein